MKNKKKSFLKGVFVLLISQIFIKIIGLVYKLYLTNKEGFGDVGNAIYSSGFQIYALLLTFSSTGVPNAISKLISERLAVEDFKGANKIFKISFITFSIIGGIASIILFLGAKTIASKWLQIPEAELSLIALAPSIFFVSIGAVMRGYFNGIQSFSTTAKSQSVEQIFKTIFTIILVELISIGSRTNTTLMAAAANLATTIATISSFSYIYAYYKLKECQMNEKVNYLKNYKPMRIRKTIKKIITVAFPISLSSLISSFNKNIDSFTIVRFLKYITSEENAKIQYGILSGKVDSLCSLPFSINIAFVTTLVPNISKMVAVGDFNGVKEKSKMFILVSILIGLPITSFMFIFSNEILTLLFPNANDGAELLKWSSISVIFMLVAQTVNAILQGIGKVNIPAIGFGIGMIFKFLCNIILLPIKQIGIFGAIVGNIICNLIALYIGVTVLKKNLDIKFEFKKFVLKPIIITCLFSIFSIVLYNNLKSINLNNMAIILSLAISMIFYIILVFMLRIFRKEEIKVFVGNRSWKK